MFLFDLLYSVSYTTSKEQNILIVNAFGSVTFLTSSCCKNLIERYVKSRHRRGSRSRRKRKSRRSLGAEVETVLGSGAGGAGGAGLVVTT